MKKFTKSMGFALNGIKLFLNERNAKLEIACAIVYSIFAFYLDFNYIEWSITLICFAMVLTAEALNTALEHVVNLVSPEYNELAGKAKDIAAGAVLVSSIFSAIIGAILLYYKYWMLNIH